MESITPELRPSDSDCGHAASVTSLMICAGPLDFVANTRVLLVSRQAVQYGCRGSVGSIRAHNGNGVDARSSIASKITNSQGLLILPSRVKF